MYRILKNDVLESAVMICILHCDEDNKDYIVLEKRAKSIRQGGEVSFPGGKKDKEDETFLDTAIRETMEELGVKKESIKNPEYYGSFFFSMGVLLEAYVCYLEVEKISDLRYNKDEVEELLIIPLTYFIETKPAEEEILVSNEALFDPRKYNFPERYFTRWSFPSRKIYIYMYEGTTIWGMTAEVIFNFINTLKKEGKVGSYEYK